METKHGENKMTRDEYLEALLPAARQATTHFVGTERERRARAMLDECTDSELLVMYNKQVVSGSIKPHTPALTHEQVERERLRGQQELLKLREDYAEKLAIRRAEEDAERPEDQDDRQCERHPAPSGGMDDVVPTRRVALGVAAHRGSRNRQSHLRPLIGAPCPGAAISDARRHRVRHA